MKVMKINDKPNEFSFTRDQLNSLLQDTIGMFVEYKDVHGQNEEVAALSAVSEMFQGLDADKDLTEWGITEKRLLQE